MEVQPLEFEKPIVELEKQLEELRKTSIGQEIDVSREIGEIESKIARTRSEIYNHLTAWQRVQIARHTGRPFMLDVRTRPLGAGARPRVVRGAPWISGPE